MPPRKNRPVLYEVVRRKNATRDVAPRRNPGAPTPPAAVPAGNAGAAPPPVRDGGSVAAATLRAGASMPASAARPPGPTWGEALRRLSGTRLGRGQVVLRLGWIEGAVAAIVLLGLLVVAYQIGRRAAAPPAVAPTTFEDIVGAPSVAPPEPARSPDARPPARDDAQRAPLRPGGPIATPLNPTGASEPPRTAPREAAARPATAAEQPAKDERAGPAGEVERFAPQPGHHYVVVQHFRRQDSAAAQKARDFLQSRGIDCVVVRGADLQLIVTEPFLLSRDAAGQGRRKQLDALKQRIRELGKEYYFVGGYSFDGARERELKP